MVKIEVIITPSGEILIPRGDAQQNKMVCELVKGLAPDQLGEAESFCQLVNNDELIFGSDPLCG